MKSKVVLLLALLMAVITTVLFFQHMKKYESTPTMATPNLVDVVVALEQIEKNEQIKEEKLQIIQVDATSVQPQSFSTKNEVVGKTATTVIVKGEQILSHRLVTEKKEITLVSRKIKEGYRAVSIGVDINGTVTNLIEPEDEVDVILSKAVGVKKETASKIILKKVRVIAVGRKMVNPDEAEAPYGEYGSVTFELKPEDALRLIDLSKDGTIHLILHKRPILKETELNETNIQEPSESDQG
jgi:pilus assembly protein CpaB